MMNKEILISVHLPKTAGSSFKKVLAECYGDAILWDYEKSPINTRPLKRNVGSVMRAIGRVFGPGPGVRCGHGHFMPLNYFPLKFKGRGVFVTWMRHPLERLISHYLYWCRTYNPAEPPHNPPMQLRRKVVEEGWSLERFCFSREMRNVYSQYLWGFPLSYFNFIGVVEHFDDDSKYFFEKFLSKEIAPPRINVNEEKLNTAYSIDEVLRKRIESFHARDMALYRYALLQRERRNLEINC